MTRVLIADDEAPARRKLKRFLELHGGLEVVAEASNGLDAVDLITITQPNIVFLDIQMPDLDGLGVAEAIARIPAPPAIVFVTAHHEYALRAFDVSAVDYLLKPFDRARGAARRGSKRDARANHRRGSQRNWVREAAAGSARGPVAFRDGGGNRAHLE